ncbi:MAG: hypothetical protein ACOYYS_19735 [Chloroflexota bacterium]
MARTSLTVQDIVKTGLAPAYAAGDAVNQHQFANDGDCYLEVVNAGASPVTVTITPSGKLDGVPLQPVTGTVPAATGRRKFGCFSPSAFNHAGGYVYVDISGASGVTLGVFRLK